MWIQTEAPDCNAPFGHIGRKKAKRKQNCHRNVVSGCFLVTGQASAAWQINIQQTPVQCQNLNTEKKSYEIVIKRYFWVVIFESIIIKWITWINLKCWLSVTLGKITTVRLWIVPERMMEMILNEKEYRRPFYQVKSF